jgi:hypothetical protein
MFAEEHRPLQALTQARPRDRLVENLRADSGISAEDIDRYQNMCVVLEYFRRPNHCGGVMMPEGPGPERRRLANGQYVEWKDVPMAQVITGADHLVKNHTPDHAKRTAIWSAMFAQTDVRRETASWEKVMPNPHEHPATPYSASRAPQPKTNLQLIQRLVALAGLEKFRGDAIAADIMHIDTFDGKERGTLFYSGPTGFQITGGRLGAGNEHTMEKVPPHFCRDQVLQYIQTQLPAEKQESVAKELFDDLSSEELEAYSDCIRTMLDAEKTANEVKARQPSLKNKSEVKNLMKQEIALDTIDCNINVSKNGFRSRRRYSFTEPMFASAVAPNQLPSKDEEERAGIRSVGSSIEWNCDQVRAMIARLIKYGDEGWTLESFRKALDGVERAKLTNFLNRRGPREGAKLGLFELCWEFFRKRELLGISLPQPPYTVRELAQDSKRKRQPLEERVANIIEQTAEEKKRASKARKIASDPEDGSIDREKLRDALAEANNVAVED